MTVREFASMGGYGRYVWSAYAFTLSALLTEVLFLLRRGRARRHGADCEEQA
jgi:heme exporter protein CcmD